jgi:hypothetical protein
LAGISEITEDNVSGHLTGWLGREGSNLRMAESKSGYFINDFKAHSE